MNSFESKKDLQAQLMKVIDPLRPFYQEGAKGRLTLGSHGTVYSESTREVEAYLRPLWGLGPYFVDEKDNLLEEYLIGIIAGTDPSNPDYWGTITDFDQVIVEMAALSTFLLLNKEKTWDKLTETQQENLYQWLIAVNKRKVPDNNWHFFRVLVNIAMKKCGRSYSQEKIEEDFAAINSFYKGEGWYSDGPDTQVDYYVSFAIHYYSLIYAHFMEKEDPKRVKVIKERATDFAQTFKYWFDAKGEALPFGRSLTYRFAQVSFFSALVFANVEALPWGEIKGIISRHLKNWFEQDIFSTDGLLTVGYHYENLVFAEGYNGPGSPYWALKSFLLLAVSDDHPYWQAKTTELTIEKETLPLPIARNFFQYNKDHSHLQAFPAGQFINNQSHAHAKYSKFVYSSKFGFSVPKSNYWYYEGAFDNTLALSKEDHYFRTKGLDQSYEILDDRIIHYWDPFEDVAIKSTIVPLENCHVRIHEIQTKSALTVNDGGFAVPLEGQVPSSQKFLAQAISSVGTSIIEGINGFKKADIVKTEPNTNLLYPLTVLPYLTTKLETGHHCLISLVSGTLPNETIIKPEITMTETSVLIKQKDQSWTITIE